MNITHALIAVKMEGDSPNILHFCGFESQPNQACIDSLREELATDPEFGLVGRADFVIMEAPEALVEFYRETIIKDQNVPEP